MARYEIGYGGVWRERFDNGQAAILRAEGLAEGGEVVEVARRFLVLHAFVTAFPASEREALRARRGHPSGSHGHGSHGGGDHGGSGRGGR